MKNGLLVIENENYEKNYLNADVFLFEKGFTEVYDSGLGRTVYIRDGEVYVFLSMNHFNTTIYSVTLQEFYEYVRCLEVE